jgi:hypothetical protein
VPVAGVCPRLAVYSPFLPSLNTTRASQDLEKKLISFSTLAKTIFYLSNGVLLCIKSEIITHSATVALYFFPISCIPLFLQNKGGTYMSLEEGERGSYL